MSTEDNKAIVTRFVEPWTTGDLTAFDETVGDAYVLHPDSTLDDLKEQVRKFRAGFPDLAIMIDEPIAEGDKVAYRWTMRGTHQGDIEGIAPTGRALEVSGITIVRVENGRIVEDWFESGSASLEEQLGVAGQQ
jgi:steroid delta-isomerase-like uncharacterized protein